MTLRSKINRGLVKTVQQLRKEKASLQAQLEASEKAVGIFQRAADISERDAEEWRRRYVALEAEVPFGGVKRGPKPKAKARGR